MRKVIYIVLISAFIACSNHSVPKDILPPSEMETIVYDLLKTDEYLNNFVVKDTTVNIKLKRSILYDQVFRLHDTNRKEFYASYRYYQQHPDIQKTLFDSVYAKASKVSAPVSHPLPIKPLKPK